MKRFLIGTSCLAMATLASPAQAQDRYLGEIFMNGYTFCPRGSVDAAGQLLAISSNTALFSLYGTNFGGDGRTTFGLPDLRGRTPIGQGTRPGASPAPLGQTGGTETVTLTLNQLPQHNHDARVRASSQGPDTNDPSGATFPTFPAGTNQYTSGADDVTMSDDEVQVARTGNSQPFEIRDPFLVTRYCVATQGLFPSRN